MFQQTHSLGTDTIAVLTSALSTSASRTRAAMGPISLATDTWLRASSAMTNWMQAVGLDWGDGGAFVNMHGAMKGEKLAYDVIADVLGIIRSADYRHHPGGELRGFFLDEEDVSHNIVPAMSAGL